MHECNFQYNGLLTTSAISDDPPFRSIWAKIWIRKENRNKDEA